MPVSAAAVVVVVVAVVVVEQAQQTNCHPHTQPTAPQMPEGILRV
jgi:hypothetical protein